MISDLISRRPGPDARPGRAFTSNLRQGGLADTKRELDGHRRRLAHRLRFCAATGRPRRRIINTRFGLLAVPVLVFVFEQFGRIDSGDGVDSQKDLGSGHGEDFFRTRAARGRPAMGPADDGVVPDALCLCGGRCGVIGYWWRHGPRPVVGGAWLFATTDSSHISLRCVHHGDVGPRPGLDHGSATQRV